MNHMRKCVAIGLHLLLHSPRLPAAPRRKQAQVLSSDYLTNIHMSVAVSPAEPRPEQEQGRTRRIRKAAHRIRKAKINICFSSSCSRSSCINISVDLAKKVAPNADTHTSCPIHPLCGRCTSSQLCSAPLRVVRFRAAADAAAVECVEL